jgi:hypothetical protein
LTAPRSAESQFLDRNQRDLPIREDRVDLRLSAQRRDIIAERRKVEGFLVLDAENACLRKVKLH